MEFYGKGGKRNDGSTIWLPYLPFQAMELINSISDNPRRKEWIMKIDGVEKTLQEWHKEGIAVESSTFISMLSESPI